MQIDVAAASVLDVSRLLIDVVTPRPIAWVTTVSAAGVVNLAPFSFFNAFGANPPVVVFSPTLRRDGTKKDTLLNLEQLGEFDLGLGVPLRLSRSEHQSCHRVWPTKVSGGKVVPIEWSSLAPDKPTDHS